MLLDKLERVRNHKTDGPMLFLPSSPSHWETKPQVSFAKKAQILYYWLIKSKIKINSNKKQSLAHCGVVMMYLLIREKMKKQECSFAYFLNSTMISKINFIQTFHCPHFHCIFYCFYCHDWTGFHLFFITKHSTGSQEHSL